MRKFAKMFWKIVLGACYAGIAVALVGQFLGHRTGPAAVVFLLFLLLLTEGKRWLKKVFGH